MQTSGTRVMNCVFVMADDTGKLNVRFKIMNLDSVKVFECDVRNGPIPNLSTIFQLPAAFQASPPVEPGALPNDPEELTQIITDLDYELAGCQIVESAECTRSDKADNKITRDLRRAKDARS